MLDVFGRAKWIVKHWVDCWILWLEIPFFFFFFGGKNGDRVWSGQCPQLGKSFRLSEPSLSYLWTLEKKSKIWNASEFACHPCTGAVLIFVSFQFYYLSCRSKHWLESLGNIFLFTEFFAPPSLLYPPKISATLVKSAEDFWEKSKNLCSSSYFVK